jgi:arylsulfatase A-like enzyme
MRPAERSSASVRSRCRSSTARRSGVSGNIRPAESLPREERKRKNLEALVRNYYRVLLSVDENVGRVLDLLDEEGLTRNTVVVYTSDNGHFLGEHGLYDKRLMYEPSIRVPMLVRFPARAKVGWWTAPTWS